MFLNYFYYDATHKTPHFWYISSTPLYFSPSLYPSSCPPLLPPLHLPLGMSEPHSVSSAIRLLILFKNWLHTKRFRRDTDNEHINNCLYKNNNEIGGNNSNSSFIDSDIKNPQKVKTKSYNYNSGQNRRSISVLLYYHLSFLSDFISSLFGCEEWLRVKVRLVITSEALAELFTAW